MRLDVDCGSAVTTTGSSSDRPPPNFRAATLADIGRAAGVSAMAASAVLNGSQKSVRISSATRERILKIAAQLRYRPNAAARALVQRRINTLGIATLFKGGELDRYFVEVFNGMMEAVTRHRQNATVFALNDWSADFARLDSICDGRIDGLILVAPILTNRTAKLLPAHLPLAALHANVVPPTLINIESDEEWGACDAVRYLTSLGHRRIMHLAGHRKLVGARRRIAGYQQALERAGIAFDPDLLIHTDLVTEAGRDKMRAWLRKHSGELLPQAIFCMNDGVAAGCIEALLECGLRIPEDVSVVGFDDSMVARTTVPQLTTVRQPLRSMGYRAVEELLARIDFHEGNRAAPPTTPIIYPNNLVHRQSVSAPPAVDRRVPLIAHQ